MKVNEVSVGRAIELMKINMRMVMKGQKRIAPIMLWGSMGVGKSDSVKRLRENMEADLGEKVGLVDLRLTNYSPVDLRGIFFPNEEKTKAKTLSLDVLPNEERDGKYGILFLDEIVSALPSVQVLGYQITLDRKIDNYSLPDGWVVVLAGNKISDKGVVNKMPSPLANRLTHVEVVPSVEDWKGWAIKNKISDYIISFLEIYPKLLFNFNPDVEEIRAFPTPRTWEFADLYIKELGGVKEADSFIRGTVGEEAFIKLRDFHKVYKDVPSLEDIKFGKDVKVKNILNVHLILSNMIINRLDEMDEDEIANSFIFIKDKMIKEVQAKTVLSLKNVGNAEKYLSIKEVVDLLDSHKKFVK